MTDEHAAELLRPLATQIDWGRPLVCLDVDGVLNVLDENSDAWEDWRTTEVDGWDVTVSDELARRLERLDAQRVWLTTWEHDANRHLVSFLGWQEQLPVLTSDLRAHTYDDEARNIPAVRQKLGHSWWKWWSLEAILNYADMDPHHLGVKLPPALVWVDDDLKYWPEARDWAACLPIPSLLIRPQPAHGVTPAQLTEIETFVAEHGRR